MNSRGEVGAALKQSCNEVTGEVVEEHRIISSVYGEFIGNEFAARMIVSNAGMPKLRHL